MGQITRTVLHASKSRWGCARLIRQWHTDPRPNGRGWRDIGYHVIILNGYPYGHTARFSFLDGAIEPGRPFNTDRYLVANEQGAHVFGLNSSSFGVCLVGDGDFTAAQYEAMKRVYKWTRRNWGQTPTDWVGHYEAQKLVGAVGDQGEKQCPFVNMDLIRAYLAEEVQLADLNPRPSP